MLGFAAVTALNLLTKGLIGIVFPLGFALLYLAFTRQLHLLRKLTSSPPHSSSSPSPPPGTSSPRSATPPSPCPPASASPPNAGWAWFYLYNEHIARFLGRRIPHDYGQVPIPIFWLSARPLDLPLGSLPSPAVIDAIKQLRDPRSKRSGIPRTVRLANRIRRPLPPERSSPRHAPLGRHHPRLLHPLLAPGVLPPPRSSRARPPRRRPPRRR